MSGKRLASFVHVNGQVYGPGDNVPADVAKEITNPKAWGDDASAPEKEGKGYGDMSPADLKAKAEELDLTVEGSGATGNVVKADLVAALEAHDAAQSE